MMDVLVEESHGEKVGWWHAVIEMWGGRVGGTRMGRGEEGTRGVVGQLAHSHEVGAGRGQGRGAPASPDLRLLCICLGPKRGQPTP